MDDITTTTPHDLVRDNNVRQVFELMLGGTNQKAACAQIGISEKTFNRGVAANNELLRQFNALIQSKYAELFDGITDVHSDILETLRKEAMRLRGLLEISLDNEAMVELEDRIKVVTALMKIDKYLVEVVEKMYPQLKEKPSAGPQTNPDDDAAALAIFKTMSGAKRTQVTISQQVITFEETERKPSGEIIEGDVRD